MVTCNLCKENKPVEEFDGTPFHYVCDDCWQYCAVIYKGEKVSKNLVY